MCQAVAGAIVHKRIKADATGLDPEAVDGLFSVQFTDLLIG